MIAGYVVYGFTAVKTSFYCQRNGSVCYRCLALHEEMAEAKWDFMEMPVCNFAVETPDISGIACYLFVGGVCRCGER